MIHQPLARYIDHAVLKPAYMYREARSEIESGVHLGVRTVCVRPSDIVLAQSLCRGTATDVCVVLSFPHGVALSEMKTAEAATYVKMGVPEIDMVVNYGLIRSAEWRLVEEDIRAVSKVTRPAGVLLKVILETSELTLDEIVIATQLAAECEADFVKTSTGFASGGATPEVVRTMVKAANGLIKVKASGGIRDRATAEMYVELGCERLGIGSTTSPVIVGDGSGAAADGTY